MEGLLQNVEIAKSAVPSLVITAVVLFLLPVVCAVFWKKRCGTSVSLAPLFIGAAGFMVCVRVLELGVHMVCIVMDTPISRFINGSTPAYVIYGILMAGIFEECGRYVIIKFLMKKNKTRENMVMYGIGHGGIEVWAISLLAVINLLVVAVVFQTQGAAQALQALGVTGSLPESAAASVQAMVFSAASFDAASGALTVLERISAMALHISLTVVVGYGIAAGKKVYLPLAVLAHAMADLFPAMSQRGVVGPWATEAWLFAWAAVLVFWSVTLYRRQAGELSKGGRQNAG